MAPLPFSGKTAVQAQEIKIYDVVEAAEHPEPLEEREQDDTLGVAVTALLQPLVGTVARLQRAADQKRSRSPLDELI